MAKVRRLGRPVLLVDGFAGPGRYGDGEIGSPLLICVKVKAALQRPGPKISVWCIESDAELCNRLSSNLSGFSFAEPRCAKFLDFLDEIISATSTQTVFVYVDPYTAADIEWKALERLAQRVHSAGASVEVLVNFNTASFVRWGLAALSHPVPAVDDQVEDIENIDAEMIEAPAADRLNRIVGGGWWADVLGRGRPFDEMVCEIAKQFAERLRGLFAEVGSVAIKRRSDDRVPKYHMVFGSRHPDALKLMNQAMVKARGQSDFQIDLFADDAADSLILELASAWMPRGELILATMRRAFCQYYEKDIRGRIEQLLKQKKLEAENGKTKINNSVRVRRRD